MTASSGLAQDAL